MSTISHAEALWQTAVCQATIQMRHKFPASNGRLNRAQEIALAGNVELLGDHSGRVQSLSDPDTRYLIQDSRCPCPDADRAPDHCCKYLLACGIVVRAIAIAKTLGAEAPEAPEAHGIPAQFLVTIQGKTFIRCDGLLHLAHERGVLSITVHFTHVTDTWVLAEATVTMKDGTKWTEAADATPDNVGAGVNPHWRRLALTRAKARALRMALGVGLIAVEELSE